ncbi:DUF5677 domain-containing protein [Acinetobacter guillouiae]|uniref:Uncharacterized protein n=1 Tax=Acinetobacter guillouiae NIPH 991 TaxID=1217656 RepID=N8WWU8_ACIGI|nr:DUF5677 domain-containing protein [Acinetobacter guillouiae]ENV16441.1 hypothetical protein F964_03376 [Acinetobacter guillouiae NIPH 991]
MNIISGIMEQLRSTVSEYESDITKIDKHIENLFNSVQEDIVNLLLDTSYKTGYISLKDQQYINDSFIANLNRRWFEAFDLLSLFNTISCEIGENIASNGARYHTESNKNSFKVLLKLHARSIQTAKEILVLMKNGYADGALARWRTLHELSVIFLFISRNGEEVALRYFDYYVVEQYKEIEAYNSTAEYLDFDKISDEDYQRIQDSLASLKIKYGDDFIKEYGWTKNIINQKKIYFNDLAKIVDLDFLNAYYKWACNPVHAGIKGSLFSLSNLNEPDMLFNLAGASNVGFTDPGQLTAFSLLQINKGLVECFDSFDHRIAINVLENFFEDLKIRLNSTQESIENEEIASKVIIS